METQNPNRKSELLTELKMLEERTASARRRLLASLFECKSGAFGQRLQKASRGVRIPTLGTDQLRVFQLRHELDRIVDREFEAHAIRAVG